MSSFTTHLRHIIMTIHLLFDLDDTLLDSNIEALIPVYFQKLTAHLADLVPPDRMLQELTRSTMTMYRNTRPDQTLEEVFSAAFYPPLGTSREALAERIEQFYDEIFPTLQPLTRPRPEAIELVEWAFSQGWTLSVATDPLFPRKAILHRLRWAGLPPETYPFRLISDFETFHFAKATVAFFPEFLGHLGWDGESPVLMIGDSIERDVIPARQAGIPVFWLRTEGQTAPEAEGIPQGTLTDLRRFLETLKASPPKPDSACPVALLAALQAGPALLHHCTRITPPAKWSVRPAQDQWALTEIICHLRDVDTEVNLPRIESVLREENPILTGQDTDLWAEQRQYIQEDGATAFGEFVSARIRLLERLKSLPPHAWERPARHTIFGPTHLRELVGFMVQHDQAHIQQAREAIAS
ncbi:MAG: DinB family protein [Anaerolineales bacterium]|nr:DinB family protein [Anaerolineales bacterium]